MADTSKRGGTRTGAETNEDVATRWGRRGVLFFAALAVWGCSAKDDTKDDTKPDAVPLAPIELAPDTTSADITWKPETVVVGADTIAASLRNRNATDGVYRFDPSAQEVAALSAGQVLVLTGVDVVRVTAVEVDDDAIVVTTEPASVTDAVSDAEISWDVGVDLSKPIQVDDGSGMLRPLVDPNVRCKEPLTPETCTSF